MISIKAAQAIAMGLILALISAFMPSAVKIMKAIYEAFISDNFSTAGFSSITVYEIAGAVTYFGLLLLTAVVGYLWEASSQKKSDFRQRKLDEQASEQKESSKFIIDYLETMPPKRYLASFQESYVNLRNTSRYIVDYFKEPTSHSADKDKLAEDINEVEGLIIDMLLTLARLTKDWDTQGTLFDNEIEYRINIMSYLEASDAVHKFDHSEHSWETSKKFFMSATKQGIESDVDGVLFVDPNLGASLCSLEKNSKKFTARNPIAIPITYPESRFHDQNLPGGPKCFATVEAQYISCCKTQIHDEINKILHLSQHMKNELTSYYCKDNFAQSIISFPLIDSENSAFGVVNVYRNSSDLAKRNANDFMALMTPIIGTISDSVNVLYSLREHLKELEIQVEFERDED